MTYRESTDGKHLFIPLAQTDMKDRSEIVFIDHQPFVKIDNVHKIKLSSEATTSPNP